MALRRGGGPGVAFGALGGVVEPEGLVLFVDFVVAVLPHFIKSLVGEHSLLGERVLGFFEQRGVVFIHQPGLWCCLALVCRDSVVELGPLSLSALLLHLAVSACRCSQLRVQSAIEEEPVQVGTQQLAAHQVSGLNFLKIFARHELVVSVVGDVLAALLLLLELLGQSLQERAPLGRGPQRRNEEGAHLGAVARRQHEPRVLDQLEVRHLHGRLERTKQLVVSVHFQHLPVRRQEERATPTPPAGGVVELQNGQPVLVGELLHGDRVSEVVDFNLSG